MTARSERFVVMPEDTALYYFTGTVAPGRWYVVTPQVLPPGAPTGAYLAELDRSRIEYVVLSNRATPEYGPAVFVVDYQQAIYGWIENNFELIRQIGDYQRDPYPPGWGVRFTNGGTRGNGMTDTQDRRIAPFRAVVTGASGFVGFALTGLLADQCGPECVQAIVGPVQHAAEQGRLDRLKDLGVRIVESDLRFLNPCCIPDSTSRCGVSPGGVIAPKTIAATCASTIWAPRD